MTNLCLSKNWSKSLSWVAVKPAIFVQIHVEDVYGTLHSRLHLLQNFISHDIMFVPNSGLSPTKKSCNSEILSSFILANRSFLNQTILKTIPVSVLLLSWKKKKKKEKSITSLTNGQSFRAKIKTYKRPSGKGNDAAPVEPLSPSFQKNGTWLSMSESKAPDQKDFVGQTSCARRLSLETKHNAVHSIFRRRCEDPACRIHWSFNEY
jgi:hypothetical protein